ncbi:patatin-like phospholipase family protein [Effusibacillus pohliae]|uniref:patatin-like phospholipase family protein n=1 Tax=Effusibacillus pohliae TaxID=232270 RepID=UPI00037EAEB7|nr:patatin-like phospholipase family protein [Effusibacillus pohliae]
MAKVGLALSGGGITGSAHIGVLHALAEAGIQIDCIAGSSCGAIVAALYGWGYSPSQLIDMVPSINKRFLDYDYKTILLRLLWPRTKLLGLIKGERIHRLIADKTRQARMTDLKMPVSITATDLTRAKQVLFVSRPLARPHDGVDLIHEIPVADAVQASLSIPVAFRPVFYKDRVYIDGGLLDNCPVSAVRALGAEKVIAVDLVFADPVNRPFDSLQSILTRVIHINLAARSASATRQADIVLRPDVRSIGLFDFSKLFHCMECGYEHTRQRIEEIKKALDTPDPHPPVASASRLLPV